MTNVIFSPKITNLNTLAKENEFND